MNPVCRLCAAPLTRTFVDLGMSPPCESYLRPDQLDEPEAFHSLHVRICERCLLVQLPALVAAEDIFTADYAYFSSYSDSWVAHARRFVEDMSARLDLGPGSFVVEAASNDGYLLQHAVVRGIRVLGVEPCGGVADAARERGVPTEPVFLGERTGTDIAERHGPADLVVANNVLAHVPDLLDFVRGLRALVADRGTVSLEFPHLLRLIEGRQYDTIYHEHYSYFTLRTAAAALATADLAVVDVEELSTHGGSLRVLARPGTHPPSEAVEKVLADERAAGLHTVDGHSGFAGEVLEVKAGLLEFLLTAARSGRTVAGYGAPGKGNTLLNHCGIREDLLPFTVDRNPHKHGMHLPGTHIPIHPPSRLAEVRPDDILILPWNLRAEIAQQLAYTREWGARLVVPIPRLEFV
ncbi:class I SAM-dependent methyltransferase [Pseudonocardia zijingensis]|uniref:Class I SAM-dependent methyltransferase n=1 Tax=Pseudonocardia zijingensis TaxID=153376 RepID=A0ABN1P7V1_9PSEU